MKAILIPIGSAGDVYPFVGLGMELQKRGYEVTIITNGYFETTVRRSGMEFAPFGTAQEYLEAIKNPSLWHPLQGLKTVARLIDQQRSLYDSLMDRYVEGQTVVVAHTLAFAARIAQDKMNMPVVTMHPAPALFRSEYEVPTMIGKKNLSRWPRWSKRLLWWAADRLMVDRVLGPVINKLRVEMGLPPVKRILDKWIHSPLLTIGMFPEWFASPQPDWPKQARLTGFPLFDAPGAPPTPEHLEKLLELGPAPVVVTPGSANIYAWKFFTVAAEACVKVGRPGVFLTRFPEQLPRPLPDGIYHFDYAPLSRILPRCAALVHHGGIGTTAAGLAGGVPQVIMPMSHDQPDNAERIRRLGVGARLFPKEFKAEALAGSLGELVASPQVQAVCRQYADRCAQSNSLETACNLIEAVVPQSASISVS